jgi:hypothetical protein
MGKNQVYITNRSTLDRTLHMSLFLFFAIIVSPTLVRPQTYNPIRINIGGLPFTDTATNRRWRDEKQYLVGNKGLRENRCTSNPVTITNLTSVAAPPDVYCSHRYFRASTDAQPYQYQIPVLNTTSSSNYYNVRLHFAEIVSDSTCTTCLNMGQNYQCC